MPLLVACDADVMDVVFPHLASVLVERVAREAGTVCVIARSRGEPVPCPSFAVQTGKGARLLPAASGRQPGGWCAGGAGADAAASGVREPGTRPVHLPRAGAQAGRAVRAHRTPPLATLVAVTAIMLAGRAGSVLLAAAGVLLSRTTMLATLMALPDPTPPGPVAVGVGDFALERGKTRPA